VTLLAASALVLSFLPFLFRHANHFYEIRPEQAQWGTAALVWFLMLAGVPAMVFPAAQETPHYAESSPEHNENEISDASGFDPVTGLYTRLSIEHSSAKNRRARRENTSLSVATIHIDEFEQATQRYGKRLLTHC